LKNTEIHKMEPIKKNIVICPEIIGPIPVTDSSYPFGAASRQTLPADLEKYGYVEEEYFISGNANVYSWYQCGKYPRIRQRDGKYTTRILVHRPALAKDFSGFAIVELSNWAPPCEKPSAGWGNSGEYFMKNNDAWIGVTVRAKTIERLQKFDYERYKDLGFPNPIPEEDRGENSNCYEETSPDTENGMIWDMLGQLAVLLKSKSVKNPLGKGGADYVLATGATGGDLTTYTAAIHPFATVDGEKPCYDGYLIHMTGHPGNINQEEPGLSPLDDRCKLFINVPIIRTNTMGDILGVSMHPDWSYVQRRHDSDLEDMQYRLYELSGTSIGSSYDRRVIPCNEDVLKCGGKPNDNPFILDINEDDSFPTRYLMRAAMHNLKLWVAAKKLPPRAERIDLHGKYPYAAFQIDTIGNICGGVRSPFVDVPIRRYLPDGKVELIDDEILLKLYPSYEIYFEQFAYSLKKCVREGWILEEDEEEILSWANAQKKLWNKKGLK